MTTSSIQQIIENLSEEELNTEILLSTYFQGTAATKSAGTSSYVDENVGNGEILPWGVKAVWKGNDFSQTEDEENNNFGEGSYAFVIDSGVIKNPGNTNDFNIEDNGWSKSWINGEDAFTDGNGHGTHVAGTIAAKVNGKGVIGVAPGALITSLKVFNSSGGGASYATVLSAIEYAANLIIDNNLPKEKCVINLSLGGPLSTSINQAVKNLASQGIQFAIAAGNEAQDADNVSPAGAGDAENVYTVSASDNKNEMASFSNWDDPFGADDVDVAAPGVNVLSYYKNGQLAYLNGTSMAAPAVAGLLITGGLEEGEDVIPNGAGYADPFALTTNEAAEDDDEDEEDGEQDGGNGNDGEDDGDEEDGGQDGGDEDDGEQDGGNGDGGEEGGDSVTTFVGNAEGDFGSFFMSSGYGSVSQGSLENGLDVSSGALDGTLEFAEDTEGSKTASNATEGSGVKITGTAKVGDEINFEYAFISNDYVPYADYSFYAINGQTFALGAIGDNVEDFGSKVGEIGYTFDTTDFDGETSGDYSISFGVVDSKDTVVDSYLAISDFYVDDGSGNDNSNNEGSFVEDPTYVFEYEEYGDALGDNGAFDLSTGGDAKNQILIEKFLDLDLGTLDGSLGSTKGAINATEGSAIMAITNAFVGDVITFDYSFSTNDYQPYKDFSFFSINGNTKKIAAVGEDTPNFGNKIGQIEYVLEESDFEIEDSNEVVLGIGIMDALDTAVDSKLSIMNLEINEAPEEGDNIDEETEDEPEEGDLSDPVLYGNVNEANDVYTLSTGGNNTVSQNNIEQNLGLISNILDSNLSSTKGAINATEGSAIQADGVGKVGDTISFEYEFSTNDYSPYKDFGFYSINNKAYKIAAVGEDATNVESISGTISYTFVESDFGGSSFGEYKLGVGVMDALDTIVDTTLVISELDYAEGVEGAEGETSDNIDLTISTFGDSYKSGDKWKMSTGYGSISQASLETSLSFVSGGVSLDDSMESINEGEGKQAINATEGSGLLASTNEAAAGDTLSFSYTFDTNDYSPYADFSFLSINGITKNVAGVLDVGNFGNVTASYEYTLTDDDFKEDENGEKIVLDIALGVVDALDTCVTSKFSVWDLAVTKEEVGGGDDEGEEDDDTVEEPADTESTGEIEIQGFGNAFESSTGMISMSTGYGAISQFVVEQKSGLELGELDGDLNNSKDALNATEGSGVTASFEAEAGDVVSFDYEFGTNDYIPFQDFSFISVNGEAQSLAVVGVDTPNFGKTTGKFNYTLTNADINKSGSGNVQFSIGIMDALDTCVTSSLKIYDFNVSSAAAVESNFSGKGLIDGLDAYMVSETLTETKNEDGEVTEAGTVLKLTDSEDQTLGDTTSDNWNISGLTPTFSISSFEPTFEALGIGTGINSGKVALWTTDSSGSILNEDIDTLDTSDAWIDIDTATANGYEAKFGKDLDNNGLVSSGTGSTAGVVLKNASDSYTNVSLTDLDGEAISQEGTDTFTVVNAVTSQGFQLFNSAATGYQILVEGKDDKLGEVGVAEVDETGQMIGEVTWQSSEEFNSVENLFNKDVDGNNLISSTDNYKLITGNNAIILKSKKGVAYNDSTSSIWDVEAASQASSGFDVLLKGEDQTSYDGKVKSWTTDENGLVKKGSAWKTVSEAIGSGWEDSYGSDLDSNGIIAGGEVYKLSSKIGNVKLQTKSGNGYNDNSSSIWNVTGALQTDSGFEVLLEGEGLTSFAGKVKGWTTDKSGVITEGSNWTNISEAIESDWENTYNSDIDNNGIISGSTSYKLVKSTGSVELKSQSGTTYTDDSSKLWNVTSGIQNKSGFDVLLQGENKFSLNSKVKGWTTDKSGTIKKGTSWTEISDAVESNWEDTYQSDIDGNGLIVGGSAYKLVNSNGSVELQTKSGSTFNDDSSKIWDALASAQTSSGFKVVLKGEDQTSLDDKIKVWSVDKEGVIKTGTSWTTLATAIKFGWEDSYQSDFDGNGVIVGGAGYKLVSSNGSKFELQSKGGKLYNDDTSKIWDVTACVQTKSGFDVLLSGEENTSLDGKVKVWTTDADGVIKKGSSWKDEQVFFAQNEAFDFVAPDVTLPEYEVNGFFGASLVATPGSSIVTDEIV